MNCTPPIPSPGASGNLVLPLGWRAEWSAQYSRYFYINIKTSESTWNVPNAPTVQPFPQSIQRKPVPGQASPALNQNQASTPVTQKAYVEAYPTPPPQVTTGYFPPTTTAQQQQTQYSALPETVQQPQTQARSIQPAVNSQQQYNPQQQYPQAVQQPQPQYAQPQGMVQPQYSPAPVQQQQVHVQQQQSYSPHSATPNSASPQYYQKPVQTFSPPPTPGAQKPQPAYNAYGQANYAQPQTYQHATNTTSPVQYPAQQQQQQQQRGQPQQQYQQQQPTPSPYPQQQQQQYTQQPPQQQQQFPQQQPQPPQQQQQQQQFPPHNPSKRTSLLPTALSTNPLMSKMSTKLTATSPADWKKWGKRAAIGVAGIGALALGADAAGDMFSGAEGMDFGGGGGGDVSGGFESGGGGGYEGGYEGSGQEALDAANVQAAIEQQGRDNASMLLDPVGTTYIYENPSQAQTTLGLI